MDTEGKTRLFFNDKPVPGSEKLQEHVAIFAVAESPTRSTFIVSSSCSGSACVDSYSVLSTTGRNAPALLTPIPDLYGVLDQTSLSVVRDRLLIDFGFRNKKRTVVEIDGQSVEVFSTTISGAKLSDDQCQWLFDTALADCTNQFRQCDTEAFSGAASRGYSFYKEHLPGVDIAEFEKLCKSVCETRQRVGVALFKNLVCHK